MSIGMACGMNNFDQTELWDTRSGIPPSIQFSAPRTPIVETLLFSPTRGAIAQVGPTRGNQTGAGQAIGREIVRRLYEPGNSLGRAFLLAQRAAILANPEFAACIRSYTLLGDPRIGVSAVTAVDNVVSGSRSYLSRPVPNPFNPVTTLGYVLKGPALVSLSIYDVQGRVVRRLLRPALRPGGRGVATWDGRTDAGLPVSSGVYFAKLIAGDEFDTRRLVLVK